MYTHQMVNRRTGEQVEQEQKTNKFYGYETHQIESAACVCVGECLCVQFFVASSKHFTILPKDLMIFLCWCLFDWFALWSIWIFNRFTRNIAQSWCIIAMCPRSHNQLSIQTKCIFIRFFLLFGCMFGQPADWLVVESSSLFFSLSLRIVWCVRLSKSVSIICKRNVTMHIEIQIQIKIETNTYEKKAASAVECVF